MSKMSRRRFFLAIIGAAVIGLSAFGLWQVGASAQARAAQTAYQTAYRTVYQTAYQTAAGGGVPSSLADADDGTAGPVPGYGPGYGPSYGPGYGAGYGMMGGYGRGFGYGMMGAYWGGSLPANAIRVDEAQAAKDAARYLTGLGNVGKDLTVSGPATEFNRAWSFLVTEKSTGRAAFRVIVDKVTGFTSHEMGLAMIWDAKYGMGGTAWGATSSGAAGNVQPGFPGRGAWAGYGCGIGGPFGTPSNGTPIEPRAMVITADGAARIASEFLASRPGDGLSVLGSPMTFYGYYEFQTAGGGKPGPLVLVNGYTGQAGFGWLGAPTTAPSR